MANVVRDTGNSMENDDFFNKLLWDLVRRLSTPSDAINYSVLDIVQVSSQEVVAMVYRMRELLSRTSDGMIIRNFRKLWEVSHRVPAALPLHNLALMSLTVAMRQSMHMLRADTEASDMGDHCILARQGEADIPLFDTIPAIAAQNDPDRHHTRLSYTITSIVISCVAGSRDTLKHQMERLYEAMNTFAQATHGAVNHHVRTQTLVPVGTCMLTFARAFWDTDLEATDILLRSCVPSVLSEILGTPMPLVADACRQIDTAAALASLERRLSLLLLQPRQFFEVEKPTDGPAALVFDLDKATTLMDEIAGIRDDLLTLVEKVVKAKGNNPQPVVFNNTHILLLPNMYSFMLLDGLVSMLCAIVNIPKVIMDYQFDIKDPQQQAAFSLHCRLSAQLARLHARLDPTKWEDVKKFSIEAMLHHLTSPESQEFPDTLRDGALFNRCVLPPAVFHMLVTTECKHRLGELTPALMIETLDKLAKVIESSPLMIPALCPMFGANIDLLITARQVSLFMTTLPSEKMELPSFKWLQRWIERVQVVCSPFPLAKNSNPLFDVFGYDFP